MDIKIFLSAINSYYSLRGIKEKNCENDRFVFLLDYFIPILF